MNAPALDLPVQVKSSQSVNRALMLFNVFMDSGHTIGVTELARRTGLPKSTAFRIVAQLTASGFIVRNGSSYRLSPKIFELGNRFIHSRPEGLKDIASPLLGDLFLQTGFMVSLTVLDGSDVLLLDRLRSSRGPVSATVVGGRRPALATASGKAIAAFSEGDIQKFIMDSHKTRLTSRTVMYPGQLQRQFKLTRETALAYELEESDVGIVSVASPILVNNKAIAAISVGGPARRVELEKVAPKVVRTARLISTHFIRAREIAHDYEPDQTHWGFESDDD